MKKTLLLALTALLAGGAAHAAEVGVSIGIHQPGLYGRIDIGRFPAPVLVSPRPVVVHAPPAVVVRPDPVYLWVPPGHRRHWHRHCDAYGACGQPVVFVQDGWARRHVVPVHYAERVRHFGPVRHADPVRYVEPIHEPRGRVGRHDRRHD